MTLTKDVREKLGIREGDKVIVNVLGDVALITKRNPGAFRDAPSFLPEDFGSILAELRGETGEFRHRRRHRAFFRDGPQSHGVSPSQDEVRALHREAEKQRQERLSSMTAIERMEEAYRLFRLARDVEEGEDGD